MEDTLSLTRGTLNLERLKTTVPDGRSSDPMTSPSEGIKKNKCSWPTGRRGTDLKGQAQELAAIRICSLVSSG